MLADAKDFADIQVASWVWIGTIALIIGLLLFDILVLHRVPHKPKAKRAAIETAAWDLEAHRRNLGLAALLAERLGVQPAEAVPCGVALGIPVDRSADTLKRWVADAVAAGYRRVKIKVAPVYDHPPTIDELYRTG